MMNFNSRLYNFLKLGDEIFGIPKYKSLLIQSNFGFIFKQHSRNNLNKNDVTKVIDDIFFTLNSYLGEKGILFCPGFFEEYSTNLLGFDLKKSKPSKSMGVFSKYIFENKYFIRDASPLTNLLCFGNQSKLIDKVNINDVNGYSTKSFWSIFSNIETKLLFVGIPPTYMTYLHFLESLHSAPYMFNKYFNVPVLDNDLVISNYSICPVRFRDSSIRWNFRAFITKCIENNALIVMPNTKGLVSLANSKKIGELFTLEFNNNPFFLLENSRINYEIFQKNLEYNLDGISLPNVHSSIEV